MPLTITLFDSPGAGTTSYGAGTYPSCMNDNGDIAGTYVDDSYNYHGFVRAANGTFTTFSVAGASETYVGGINSSGVICGWCQASPHNLGFVRAIDGTITTFNVSGAINIQVGAQYIENGSSVYGLGNSINDAGTIVGSYRDAGGIWHGFLRDSSGTITTFSLSGDYTNGIDTTSINTNGDICGDYGASGGALKGFIRTAGGTITQFGGTGNTLVPYKITDSGECSGYLLNASFQSQAFVRDSGGTLTIYNVVNSSDGTFGSTVNSAGVAIGFYLDANSPFSQLGYIRQANGTISDKFDALALPTNDYTFPWAINTAGKVIGSTIDSTGGIARGFIAVPASNPPDFSIAASPTTVIIPQGGSDHSIITVSPINGFTGSVALTDSGKPTGVTTSFSTNPITGGSGTSTYGISVDTSVGTGNYPLVVTGTSGALVHTADILLEVTREGVPQGFLQLIGGAFQDPLQHPVANGELELVLTQSNSQPGYWYTLMGSSPAIQVCQGLTFKIPLDANGNIETSTPYFVIPNDNLIPANSYYLVSCYTAKGQLVWGPNCQQVFFNYSPLSTTFDVGQWVPNRITES